MCIPNTQCRLHEITERSDASRQPSCFFITCPWVPGQYGKPTLLFRNPYLYPINQITVTFESSSCTLLSASNQQAYRAADAQLLEAICFLSFFPSCAVNTPLDHCPLQPRAWSQSLTSEHTSEHPLVLNSVCLCVECLPRWCLGSVKDDWEADSRDLDSHLGGKYIKWGNILEKSLIKDWNENNWIA